MVIKVSRNTYKGPLFWSNFLYLKVQTLYKTADPAMAHTVGLTTIHARYKLHSLPIWLCLQSLGHEGVVDRVKFSRDLVSSVMNFVSRFLSTIFKLLKFRHELKFSLRLKK